MSKVNPKQRQEQGEPCLHKIESNTSGTYNEKGVAECSYKPVPSSRMLAKSNEQTFRPNRRSPRAQNTLRALAVNSGRVLQLGIVVHGESKAAGASSCRYRIERGDVQEGRKLDLVRQGRLYSGP